MALMAKVALVDYLPASMQIIRASMAKILKWVVTLQRLEVVAEVAQEKQEILTAQVLMVVREVVLLALQQVMDHQLRMDLQLNHQRHEIMDLEIEAAQV